MPEWAPLPVVAGLPVRTQWDACRVKTGTKHGPGIRFPPGTQQAPGCQIKENTVCPSMLAFQIRYDGVG